MLYGSPCKFLGICSGHDTPDSDKWRRKKERHPELGDAIEHDADALTNSRIRTFQTCRRKHFYEYELGIERQDEDEKEALYFGAMFHAALEAWWRCFLVSNSEVSHVNGRTDSPASGVGQSPARATRRVTQEFSF